MDKVIPSFTTKEFPPEFENLYIPCPVSSKQHAETVLTEGVDRRRRIMGDGIDFHGCGEQSGTKFGGTYPSIGLLRMEFNGTCYQGTATMIADGSFLLTCAHNFLIYSEISEKFVKATSAFFELRDNKAEGGAE